MPIVIVVMWIFIFILFLIYEITNLKLRREKNMQNKLED
jgi:hypothetical protein